MVRFLIVVFAALLTVAALPVYAGTTDITTIFQALQGELSGNRARDYVMRLWEHDKWSTLPEWNKSAAEAEAIMKERGFDETKLDFTPADGITNNGGWINPIGWDVKQATLEVIEPSLPDEFRFLCNYRDNPTSLNVWSAPTPPEGIETELVLMEGTNPAELGRLDAKGKIVLTSGGTRFYPGTLFFAEIPVNEWKEVSSSPHFWSAGNWAAASYWWVDGKRNLVKIKKLCELEAGRPMTNFNLINYYAFLKDHKYVEYVTPPKEEPAKKGKK